MIGTCAVCGRINVVVCREEKSGGRYLRKVSGTACIVGCFESGVRTVMHRCQICRCVMGLAVIKHQPDNVQP